MTAIRVKENRFFAGPDRFIKHKTDLFENFSSKIGPRKFSLWQNFPVNRWKHLVKTDKYLVKCQAVYCPCYVIQLSPVLGPCEVKFDKKHVYEILADFVASREIMVKELDSQSARMWLGDAWF